MKFNIKLGRALVAVIVSVGLLLAGTGTAQAVDYGSGAWGGPVGTPVQDAGWASPTLRVGMAGDSITNRCAPELRAAFAAEGVSFAVRGYSGQNTEGTNNWTESLSYVPDIFIMATGTNDIFNPPAMAAQIARTKSAVGLGTELVWVDTYAARAGQTEAVQLNDVRNSGWVNSQIHAAIPADHVADWNANMGQTIGRGLPLSYYLQDGVHPWAAAGTGHGDGCANFTVIVMNTVRPLL